jgi:hypothetical protein
MKHISKYLHNIIHEATSIEGSDAKQEITITVHYKKEKQGRYNTNY